MDLDARLFLGIGSIVWGTFLCYYGWRYLHVRITVSPEGIEARLYFRTVRIRWDEVVALVTRRCSLPMAMAGAVPIVGVMDAGSMFWVYSRREKLWFSGQLVGSLELVELISQSTGLDWAGR